MHVRLLVNSAVFLIGGLSGFFLSHYWQALLVSHAPDDTAQLTALLDANEQEFEAVALKYHKNPHIICRMDDGSYSFSGAVYDPRNNRYTVQRDIGSRVPFANHGTFTVSLSEFLDTTGLTQDELGFYAAFLDKYPPIRCIDMAYSIPFDTQKMQQAEQAYSNSLMTGHGADAVEPKSDLYAVEFTTSQNMDAGLVFIPGSVPSNDSPQFTISSKTYTLYRQTPRAKWYTFSLAP